MAPLAVFPVRLRHDNGLSRVTAKIGVRHSAELGPEKMCNMPEATEQAGSQGSLLLVLMKAQRKLTASLELS